MSQEDFDTILCDLCLQRRNIRKDFNDVLDRCEMEDGLSKTEIEGDRVRLEPLVDEFVKTAKLFRCA